MFGFEFSFNTTLFDFGTYHAKDESSLYNFIIFIFKDIISKDNFKN